VAGGTEAEDGQAEEGKRMTEREQRPVAILYYSVHTNEWFALAEHGQVIAHDRQRAGVIRMCWIAGYKVIEAKNG
jgi:hypothetical protein